MSPRLRHLLLTTSALLVLGSLPGAAGPDGANVVGGSASVQGQGTGSVIVNQSSDRAIINWNTFNIGTGESARFNQPGVSSVILNRVIGGLGPSTIDGTLTANGRVFVVNGDGLVIGSRAVINTAGFLATTSDIKNKDFMGGRYNFSVPGRPDASIVNQGHITATSGGFAALVAPGVRNSGTISATLGTVALASGNMFTLDLYGDRLIQLGVGDKIASQVLDVATGRPLSSLVTNDGKLKANGGRVELTAAAARHVVDSVINTTGVIEANSVGRRNGMIVIGAATAGSRGADLPRQTVRIAGRVSAAGNKKGTRGGTIVVTGEDIQLANAQINASGRAGGGRVLIGGDWGGGNPTSGAIDNPSARLESFRVPTAATVSVDAASTIDASARDRGNGGKVVLWSDTATTFAGTIFARGGTLAGDGGFVETSSHGVLAFNGTVNTLAANGKAGTLLLDPTNLHLNATGIPPISDPGSSAIAVGTVQTQLASGNVVVATAAAGIQLGDISVEASLGWSTAHTLTLSAHRNIDVHDGVTISSSGGGNLVLRADSTGTGIGTLSFPGDHTGHITVSGGSASIYYNPTTIEGNKYDNPTNFGPRVTGPFTAYMLVNNASDLSLIGANATTLGGTYALGRDIDLNPISNWTPLNQFTGVLDGNGGLGDFHRIDHLSINSASPAIGLFSTNTGTIRNLALTNTNVIGTGTAPQSVGALVGQNSGSIINVSAAGTVSGPGLIGGLVGLNLGTASIVNSTTSGTVTGSGSSVGGIASTNEGLISSSHSSATVIATSSLGAGGIVGFNFSTGTISETFSTGPVSGTSTSGMGGIAGFNDGTIERTFSTSQVNGTNTSWVGGLVGANSGQVSNAYAMGTVGNGSTTGAIGGLIGFNVGTVSTSYSTGAVAGMGGSSTGGLVGLNSSAVTNSYWDIQTSGQTTSAGGTGLTTAQLQAALPSGFDSNAWGIVPGVSYPFLNWQFPVGTPQVVSGIAFSDHGVTPVAGGTVVAGVLSGSLLRSVLTDGPVTTGANGYYYYLLAPGTISPPATELGVGTFQAGTLAGATYLQNVAGSATGLDIYGTYLRGVTSAGTLSAFNAGLATAIGSHPEVAAVVNALPNRQIEAKGASFTIDQGLHVTGTAIVNAAGPLTIASEETPVTVTGTNVVLTTPGAFINNAGSAAVTATGGRWLIYSHEPSANTFGNLDSANTAIWNADASSLPPANVTAGGNRYIFAFQPTLTFTSTDLGKTYGDNAAAAVASAFTFSGLQPGVAQAFVGDTAASAFSGAPSLFSAGAASTASVAGSPYPITISAGSLNSPSGYAFAFNSAGVLTVDRRPLTISADARNRLYGDPNPALTFAVGGSGLVNGDTISGALATTATPTSNVGAYPITQGTLAASNNYTITNFVGANLTVDQRPLTITADARSRLYGDPNPTLTFAVGGSGLVNGDTLSGALATTATPTSNVGAYPITQGTLAASNNYTITNFVGANLTVDQRPLTITADARNRLYGDPNPALTFAVGGSGLVNGDTLSGALATTATPTSNVGAYPITQGTLAASNNYTITNFVGANLTVDQRPLTISADARNRLYGDPNPALTFAVGGSGLVNGDTLSGALATTATPTSNVGAYPITQGTLAASNNYTITNFVGANLTVDQRPLTISADARSRLYGDPNPALTFAVGGSGLVNGDTLSGALATTATVTSNVGAYPITQGTLAVSANYQVTFLGNTLTVNSRPLTITADDANKREGQTLTFAGTEFHTNGLVNGDTVTAVTLTSPGAAAAALAANSPFAIRATDPLGTGLANYAISFVDGTLTVNANPQQATTTQIAQQLVNQAQPPTTPPQLFNLIALNPPATPGGSSQSSPPRQGGPPSTRPNGNTPATFLSTPFFIVPAPGAPIVPNEAVWYVRSDVTRAMLDAVAAQLGVTVLDFQSLGTLGVNMVRINTGNLTVTQAVVLFSQQRQIAAAATANYAYRLTQDPAARTTETPQGDAGQYVLGKLRLSDIHRATRGTNVSIAVIDSQIDAAHPDLEGVVSSRFDATDTDEPPHAHGTGMAGAIASHRRLLGVAPGAHIIAIRAFSSKAASAESTTFNILRGIDYAINNGVRIINMSFAGPRDPSLERALKVANSKGIILIAAAGNAGPKSPPLYPAADPNVIAVTATDIDDKLFTGANRGRHIAIAAPGVDILVPAPENSYQLTTGTSVATAHISGIVALMLERNPKLTPDDIRKILTASAKRLGPNNEFGAGLVDPAKALRLSDPRSVTFTGSVTR